MEESAEYRHNLALLSTVSLGDLVEFPRAKGYSHYGVYVGEGYVIHLTSEDTVITVLAKGSSNLSSSSISCRKLFAKGTVIRQNLLEVAGKIKARVNNYLDHKLKPYDARTIVERAESKEGKQCYDIFSQNCEHFATWCRYGVKKSLQVAKGLGSMVS